MMSRSQLQVVLLTLAVTIATSSPGLAQRVPIPPSQDLPCPLPPQPSPMEFTPTPLPPLD